MPRLGEDKNGWREGGLMDVGFEFCKKRLVLEKPEYMQ